ncbi:MAG: BrnT family toxin [Beijerinckiaceae bacterium]
MEFDWNEEKNKNTEKLRGINFYDAIMVFKSERIEWSSDKNGERRWVTVGFLRDRLIAVIYTVRGDKIRIISARRARKNEERAYYNRYPRRSVE